MKGNIIDFTDDPPVQMSYPHNSIGKDRIAALETEINSLLEKRVTMPTKHEPGEFIPPIFSVPKPNGQIWLILNLKKFNQFISTAHFKMDNIHTVSQLITHNCWMASIDLKDAYYSVKIEPSSQKYLKFSHNNTLYQFTVFPNGICTCPRKFT